MKENKIYHMFHMFLTGILISVILVMMRLGGSVNFEEFMSAGRVFDISPVSLQNSSSTWKYDKDRQGYWLLSDKSVKYFKLDGQERTWNHLYITIKQLSSKPLVGVVRYYGKDKKKLYQQPVELYEGINAIPLDETVPMVKFAIVFQDVNGAFISISEMQVRTTPSWFTIPHFLKLFAVSFTGVMLVIGALMIFKRRFYNRGKSKSRAELLFGIQAVIQTIGDFTGERIGGRLSFSQKTSMRKLLFGMLLLWMMIGNTAGWLSDKRVFRYYVLICALLLLIISFVSWEQPLKKQQWMTPLMKNWLGIWLGAVVCDLFVVRELELTAATAMLFSGSVFVFVWQNMERPDEILADIMSALEITFFASVIYCMVFRMKKPGIDYNGMFKSPEQLAMYAVLMEVVFLTRMDWLTGRSSNRGVSHNGKGILIPSFKNILGGAVSLLFVLRSGHTPGIVIFLFIIILSVPRIMINWYNSGVRRRKLLLCAVASLILAYGCTCLVFVSTKFLPQFLDLNVEYEQEILTTRLEGEEKELFLLQYPGSLEGTSLKKQEKLPVIWRNYARRLNLFGHAGMLRVFRNTIPAYSGYLDMAFHHGIFILLPYLTFQITMICGGIQSSFRKKTRGSFYILYLGIAYLCFSVCTNVEISWGHPFWLCYYLSAGYLRSVNQKQKMKSWEKRNQIESTNRK
ncbi:hypothetical protein D3Z36_05095 [Lachnospiraceae bacterium]|nr:hypothetical protein [Lachnospiraceae bacterium]